MCKKNLSAPHISKHSRENNDSLSIILLKWLRVRPVNSSISVLIYDKKFTSISLTKKNVINILYI